MATQKMSFKVPPSLWASFKQQANGLSLSVAPFLNRMIEREVPELQKDLRGRQSLRAKRYISGELKRKGAKTVNIEVEKKTKEALDEVTRNHNMVRDAFMCRLLIFLRSSDALLKYLDIPNHVLSRYENCMLDKVSASPMKAMEEFQSDPLFFIRSYVGEKYQKGIYCVELPRELDWAACYLEDKEVPGTEDYRETQKELAESFELLEGLVFGEGLRSKEESVNGNG